ncbi:MAG: ribosomal protection-like ABC-F family protein [Chthonomonadales bacterium]
MSLLTVSNISKHFGPDTILDGVSFRLEWGKKLGLVGRNGTGKTTLMRILTGQMEPDSGTINFSPGIRFGYLRQEQMVELGRTVQEEAVDAFGPVLEMERRLRELETHMAEHHDHEQRLAATMDEYGLLHDRFEAMGGYENLRDIPQVLQRLGFSASDLSKPTSKLSGGEKTRLAVAKLLLSAPDVLLLDEPTNHLDLQATEWLESFLHDFGGAIILVSHDRIFLDQVVDSVAELERGKMVTYKGDFSAYWKQKEAARVRQAELHERDQKEVQRLLEFFEKWKNTPSKRSQAVMRQRWAERIKENMTEAPVSSGKTMKVSVKERSRSGNDVMIVDHLTKKFGERTLFDDVSLHVGRGQRVGIVGPNGAGKSTLIRMLLGREQPTEGSVRLGTGVTVGYFAQEASDLDLTSSVLENMLSVGEMLPTEARTHLGKFLFTGDDVFRPVEKLSGGEKNKLALAIVTWLRPNLLILDEPTNHLDIDSREALNTLLKSYDGTLILVSHDRHLLNEVTNFTIEIEGGKASTYAANYAEYRERKQRVARQAAQARADAAQARPTPGDGSPIAGMNSHQLSKERQRSVKAVQAAEKRVAEAEDWMKRIEEALAEPNAPEEAIRLSHEYEKAQAEMTEAMGAWEKGLHYAQEIGAAV